MPDQAYQTADLHTQIRVVCDMMISTHYYEEANWLWMAAGAPRHCTTERAQEVLRRAGQIAREFGFAEVARWAIEIASGRN